MYSLKNFDKCIQSCNLYSNQGIQNISITPKVPLCPFAVNTPLPTLATTDLFPDLRVLPFPEHRITMHYVSIQCISFRVWLLAHSIMLSRLIHIIARISSVLLLWLSHTPLCAFTTTVFLLSQTDELLGWLQFGPMNMNKTAMDTCV